MSWMFELLIKLLFLCRESPFLIPQLLSVTSRYTSTPWVFLVINITCVLQRTWHRIIHIYGLLDNNHGCHLLMRKLSITRISCLAEDPLLILILPPIALSDHNTTTCTEGSRDSPFPKDLSRKSLSQELDIRVANKSVKRKWIAWTVVHLSMVQSFRMWRADS